MDRRLLLIDGTGLFYRSFFAIKNLSTRAGSPTNAIFGFIRACHQLKESLRPSHLAVAWDGGAPQTRLSLVPEYKAQRPGMPDALRAQYEGIVDYLEQAQIPLIRMEGQEADDVLASVAEQGVRDGADVLVATSDKDMYQIVGNRTRIVPAAKDAPLVDPAGVVEKTGVHPWQIVDWLALTGDTVDNVPGVPGLGPKTAARLLQAYESVDELWRRIREVESEKLRENLLRHREVVERNRKVMRLDAGLPCSPGWNAMVNRAEEPERMRPFYERMEFHSFLKAVDQPLLLGM